MKEKLQSLGWQCKSCHCPGKTGYDCSHKDFRGIVIALKSATYFRIVKKGNVIAAGRNYQLEDKLREHELVQVSGQDR